MAESDEVGSMGLAARTDIDGDSPTVEGVCLAHVQVMDAFDAAQIEVLLRALGEALGQEIAEARSVPSEPNRFRGGPYLLGGFHRRAWRVTWEELPPDMRRSMGAEDLAKVKSIPTELVVQWADHLPFAVVVVRAPPGPQADWVAYAAENLLDALPGRLGPNNRMPRSESQLLLAVKISNQRMKRIRDAMESGSDDDALRRDVAESLQLVGKAAGNLRLESPFSNVLLVEGHGSRIIGDDDSLEGPFRAFVFSNGNQGPHSGYRWHIPIWIPTGVSGSSWPDFNFHPFLFAAIRNAEHVSVETGHLDEALVRISRQLLGITPAAPVKGASAGLQGDLVRLHAQVQALETTLHLGATRSTIGPETESSWSGRVHHEIQDDQGWPSLSSASMFSESLKATKVQAEQDAKQVLENLETRIGRALDLVTTVENHRLNRSMRFWTIVAAGLALLAIVIAVFRP